MNFCVSLPALASTIIIIITSSSFVKFYHRIINSNLVTCFCHFSSISFILLFFQFLFVVFVYISGIFACVFPCFLCVSSCVSSTRSGSLTTNSRGGVSVLKKIRLTFLVPGVSQGCEPPLFSVVQGLVSLFAINDFCCASI